MQMIYISLHQGKWELGKKLESPFSSPYRWLGPALLLPPPPNPNFYSSPCIKLLFKATLGLFPPKPSRIPEDGDAQSCRTLWSTQPKAPERFILNLPISVSFNYFPPPLPHKNKKNYSPTSAWDTIQADTETPSPPSVSPFSGSHLEHRVFPLPQVPPNLLFWISLGEVAISGDLGVFFFFQLVYCCFGVFFRAGIPLVALFLWGGLGGFMDSFLGGPGRVRPAPAAVGVQPSSP